MYVVRLGGSHYAYVRLDMCCVFVNIKKLTSQSGHSISKFLTAIRYSYPLYTNYYENANLFHKVVYENLMYFHHKYLPLCRNFPTLFSCAPISFCLWIRGASPAVMKPSLEIFVAFHHTDLMEWKILELCLNLGISCIPWVLQTSKFKCFNNHGTGKIKCLFCAGIEPEPRSATVNYPAFVLAMSSDVRLFPWLWYYLQ